MRHTYILSEGEWESRGQFFDAAGIGLPAEGRTRIVHEARTWKLTGYMRIISEPPVEFRNDYSITPFPEGGDTTVWSSVNPALGRMNGRFTLVEDSILSLYNTDDGAYRGVEYLFMIGEGRYINRGVLYHNGGKVSSWAVELRRVMEGRDAARRP